MRIGPRRKILVAVILLVAGMMFLGNSGKSSAAGSNELTVTLFGGTFEKFYRSNVLPIFEKETGAKVNVVSGLTMQNLAKLRASKGNPQVDVVGFDPPGSIPAANEGLLEKLDPNKIPNLNKLYPWALSKDGYRAAFLTYYECLTYNTKFIKTPPTSWTDLWKPEYKGKVIIPDISTSNGIRFISVTSKVATGSDWYNTDAAFEKLKMLKPNVLTYWTSLDQVAQLLNSGQAWLAGGFGSDRALTQVKAGAPIDCVIPKEGGILGAADIAIAKGTKHLDLAEKYVNIVLSRKVQVESAYQIFLGPTNKDAKLEGPAAKYLSVKKGLETVDWIKLGQLEPLWADRWNREMLK